MKHKVSSRSSSVLYIYGNAPVVQGFARMSTPGGGAYRVNNW